VAPVDIGCILVCTDSGLSGWWVDCLDITRALLAFL
jgi:hypothetical protein